MLPLKTDANQPQISLLAENFRFKQLLCKLSSVVIVAGCTAAALATGRLTVLIECATIAFPAVMDVHSQVLLDRLMHFENSKEPTNVWSQESIKTTEFARACVKVRIFWFYSSLLLIAVISGLIVQKVNSNSILKREVEGQSFLSVPIQQEAPVVEQSVVEKFHQSNVPSRNLQQMHPSTSAIKSKSRMLMPTLNHDQPPITIESSDTKGRHDE